MFDGIKRYAGRVDLLGVGIYYLFIAARGKGVEGLILLLVSTLLTTLVLLELILRP